MVGTRNFTDALFQAIDACKNQAELEPDGIIGHSYGGELVHRLDKTPAATYKKILLAPTPLEGGRESIIKLIKCRGDIQKLLQDEQLYKQRFCSEKASKDKIWELINRLQPFPFKAYYDINSQPGQAARKKTSENDTQLIIGNNDATFPRTQYASLLRHLKNNGKVNFKKIDGSHNFYIEDPEETAEHISDFLQNLPPPDRKPAVDK